MTFRRRTPPVTALVITLGRAATGPGRVGHRVLRPGDRDGTVPAPAPDGVTAPPAPLPKDIDGFRPMTEARGGSATEQWTS
jgi:hypothetical protein